MSFIRNALPLAVALLALAACSRSPQQLIADCAKATTHRLETGVEFAPVALDKISADAVKTCGDAFDASKDARSAFGAGRAALAQRDFDLTVEWMEKASEAGYRQDLVQIGIMSAYVERAADAADFEKALAAGIAAKEAGAQDASVMLAEIYSNPSSGHYDFDAAVLDYEIAAKTESNGLYATHRLATIYLERGQSGKSPNYRNDLLKALNWTVAWAKLEENADAWKLAGDIASMDGFAGPSNPKAIAQQHYRKAAELGHPEAAFQAGYALYFGEGVSKDTTASRPYFQTAAAANDARANYILGHMYWSGNGASRDAYLAEKHLLAAVEAGHEEAKKLYDESIKPLMVALRAMPSRSAQSCMDGKRSQYNDTMFEVYNVCAEPMNVLICENYALTDFIGFFQGKDNTTCRIKRVAGGGFVESMYFSESDAALGWQMISGSKLQWGACYSPLQPSITSDGKVSCDW